MKVAFIIGSNNFEENGISAYTLKLSSQIIALGNEVAIFVLKDSLPISTSSPNRIELFDLTKAKSILQKLRLFKLAINRFSPDIVSIQYAPYSFNKKGISYDLLLIIPFLIGVEKHWMVHETWIEKKGKLKYKIAHCVQKMLLKFLLKISKPSLVTTTIEFFQIQISKECKIIPLFGNITPAAVSHSNEKISGVFTCITFGNFSPIVKDFEEQLIWIKNYCAKNSLIPKVIVCGNITSRYGQNSIETIYLHFMPHQIEIKGWLPENEISQIFQMADLGVSRANHQFLGKSGSSIAMLEHGLPILLRGKKTQNSSEYLSFHFAEQLFFIDEIPDEIPKRKSVIVPLVFEHTNQLINLYNESLLPYRGFKKK